MVASVRLGTALPWIAKALQIAAGKLVRQTVPLHWNDLRGLATAASATGMGGILFQVDPPTLELTIAESPRALKLPSPR